MIYVIKEWDDHFECAQSRKLQKLSFVPFKNKMDGKGFRKLAKIDPTGSVFAAFIMLVEIASRCPERGKLYDSDGPLTFEDFELKTGYPASMFEGAIKVLVEDVCWVEVEENPPLGHQQMADKSTRVSRYRIEQNYKEKKELNTGINSGDELSTFQKMLITELDKLGYTGYESWIKDHKKGTDAYAAILYCREYKPDSPTGIINAVIRNDGRYLKSKHYDQAKLTMQKYALKDLDELQL